MPVPKIIRIDPKAAFIDNKERKVAHSDMMASPGFHEAAKTALLVLQMRLLPDGQETTSLAAAALKLAGAQAYLRVLMNLAEPESPEQEADDPNLTPPEEFWKNKPQS